MNLYSSRVLVQPSDYPLVRSRDHTMGKHLTDYVHKRIPTDVIGEAVRRMTLVEVHGIFDGHIDIIKKSLGWDTVTLIRDLGKSKKGTKSNFERPKVYRVTRGTKEFIVMTVFPGEDYVKHYAALVRYAMEREKKRVSEQILVVFRYPEVEKTVYEWSGLSKSHVIRPGDVIVLGYVGDVMNALILTKFKLNEVISDPLYEWVVLENRKHRRVLLLNFSYSYWGSTAGHIAEGLYRDGANLIIHVAKAGSCKSASDVHSKSFIPQSYAKVKGEEIEYFKNPWNPILERNPGSGTGLHVAVSTILEETYTPFREIVSRLGANSIDIEGPNMVHAAEKHCRIPDTQVGFSGVYVCSDYVRKSPREKYGHIDLATADPRVKYALKDAILNCILRFIVPYLQNLKTTTSSRHS